MAKAKQIFFCQECGYESSKWMGQCPACRAWNTFVEEKAVTTPKGTVKKSKLESKEPTSLFEVSSKEEERIGTEIVC